jgi:predicted nucleic acid-binding Zn ribbon protein
MANARSFPRRKPPRPRNPEPVSIASLMPTVLARIGGASRVTEHRVFEAWVEVVGARTAALTRAESLREGTLTVRVDSSALAHELTLLRRQILEKLAVKIGPDVVKDLRTRVGPVRGGGEG